MDPTIFLGNTLIGLFFVILPLDKKQALFQCNVLKYFFGSFEVQAVEFLGSIWQTDVGDNFGSNFLSGQVK